MTDNKKIAQDVLEAVGGKDNVCFATHCMTRLRLNLRDASAVDDSKVKAIDGVLGIQRVGRQYQVIIGQNVAKVYPEFTALAGVEEQDVIDENLDDSKDKEPMSLKKVGTAILDYLSQDR